MPTCHRHYPGRFNGACPLVYLHCQRPSPCNSKVGSCNYCFGACSAFTHVMACTLAESPSDPLHRELRQLCCIRCRLDCYRVERTSSRAGVAPAEVQRLSRRTVSPVNPHINSSCQGASGVLRCQGGRNSCAKSFFCLYFRLFCSQGATRNPPTHSLNFSRTFTW